MPFLRCVLYLAVLGVLAHIIGEALPRRWFSAQRFPFRSARWEKDGRIYKKLGVHRWKDHVPDMSRIMKDMRPKRLEGAELTAQTLQTLVQETCVAECVHAVLILLSPVLLVLWPGWGGAALCAFDILLLNLPFILIQRYNRPKLAALAERRQRRAAPAKERLS